MSRGPGGEEQGGAPDERRTVVIGGRAFVLGALYAPAEPVSGRGHPRAARRLLAHVPPERCASPWYAARGGRVRAAALSGAPLPPWSGDHWVAWAGEEVAGP